ncbi:hypothetical protein HK104_005168 [Borealophlyctis nickersoniae]|nr:hypothetical protein HK104_005168 [Borealophlyctis nickersoniae]
MSKQNRRTVTIRSPCLEPDSDIEEVPAPAPPPAKKRKTPTPLEKKKVEQKWFFKSNLFGPPSSEQFEWTPDEFKQFQSKYPQLCDDYTRQGDDHLITPFADYDRNYATKEDLPDEETEQKIRTKVTEDFHSLFLNENFSPITAYRDKGFASGKKLNKQGKYEEKGKWKISFRMWAHGLYTTRRELQNMMQGTLFDQSVYDAKRSMNFIGKHKTSADKRILKRTDENEPLEHFIVQNVPEGAEQARWRWDRSMGVQTETISKQEKPSKNQTATSDTANDSDLKTLVECVTKLFPDSYPPRELSPANIHKNSITLFVNSKFCLAADTEHDVSVNRIHFNLTRKSVTFKCPHCDKTISREPKNAKLKTLIPEGTNKSATLEWSFINKIPGWEDFDICALVSPTHMNMARWFISVKRSTIIKHPSDVIWVLGANNIWRMAQQLKDTDIRLQIQDVIFERVEMLLDDICETQYYRDNGDDLEEVLCGMERVIKNKAEDAHFTLSVAEMVYLNFPVDSNAAKLFLSQPNLLPFNDCVYDLNTGRTYPIEPSHYVIRTTRCDFPRTSNPDIRATLEKFYNDSFPDEKLRLYRLRNLARSLWGKVMEEMYLVLKGKGRNGKGTEDELIAQTFGDFYKYISQQNLTSAAREPDKPNSQLYECFARRYIATSENSPGQKFLTTIIKPITANDPYPVHTLRGKPLTSPFTGQLNIQTNDDIVFDKVDFGGSNRNCVLEYMVAFVNKVAMDIDDTTGETESSEDEVDEVDEEDEEDLNRRRKGNRHATQNEIQDILPNNFAIPTPTAVSLPAKRLLADSMTSSKWFKRHYVITNENSDRIKRKTMYEDYVDSLPETKRENCISKVAFFNELRAVLMEKTIKGIPHFVGVKLKRPVLLLSEV